MLRVNNSLKQFRFHKNKVQARVLFGWGGGGGEGEGVQFQISVLLEGFFNALTLISTCVLFLRFDTLLILSPLPKTDTF